MASPGRELMLKRLLICTSCIKGAGVGGKAAEGGKAAACASKTFSIEEVQGDYPRK